LRKNGSDTGYGLCDNLASSPLSAKNFSIPTGKRLLPLAPILVCATVKPTWRGIFPSLHVLCLDAASHSSPLCWVHGTTARLCMATPLSASIGVPACTNLVRNLQQWHCLGARRVAQRTWKERRPLNGTCDACTPLWKMTPCLVFWHLDDATCIIVGRRTLRLSGGVCAVRWSRLFGDVSLAQ
jgi:hypothetical protein